MGLFIISEYPALLQMGTNYKAALIPQRIRETIHGWKKSARKKRRHGLFTDDSTIHTDASTVLSVEDDDRLMDVHEITTDLATGTVIEMQPETASTASPLPIANETSSRASTPLLRPSASVSSATRFNFNAETITRSSSMPTGREITMKENSLSEEKETS